MLTAGVPATASAIPTLVTGHGAETPTGMRTSHNESPVMGALHQAKTSSLNNINDFVRQSVQSLRSSNNQSLNESAIADAIA